MNRSLIVAMALAASLGFAGLAAAQTAYPISPPSASSPDVEPTTPDSLYPPPPVFGVPASRGASRYNCVPPAFPPSTSPGALTQQLCQ
jgi:hypothetical protein